MDLECVLNQKQTYKFFSTIKHINILTYSK